MIQISKAGGVTGQATVTFSLHCFSAPTLGNDGNSKTELECLHGSNRSRLSEPEQWQDESIFAPIDLSYDFYKGEAFKQRYTENRITACKYLVVRQNQVFVSPDAVGSNPTRVISGSRKYGKTPELFDFPGLLSFQIA